MKCIVNISLRGYINRSKNPMAVYMYPAVCLCAPILKWVCPAKRMWTNGFCFSYSEQDILYWPRLFRSWIHGDSNLSKFPLGTHIWVNLIPFYSFPKMVHMSLVMNLMSPEKFLVGFLNVADRLFDLLNKFHWCYKNNGLFKLHT